MRKLILLSIYYLLLISTNLVLADDQAKRVTTSTTAFNNNLSSSDTTVQKALDTIDNLSLLTQSSGDSRYVNITGDTMSGNLVISNDEPTLSFSNNLLGVTAVFRSTYFQVADDTPFSGLYGEYKATTIKLATDGGTQESEIVSDGISMAFYPEITHASGMTLAANSLDLSGTDPAMLITDNGGGSAAFYYNRFQFSNFFSSYYAEISSDGLNYLEIKPTTNDDVQYRFTNQGVLQSIGTNGSPFQFKGKDALAGTNLPGGPVRIVTGSSKGNGVANVDIYATGGGSSGSSTQNANLVATFAYNNLTFPSAYAVLLASDGSLQLPYASSPTVDANGEIAVDSTDNQLIYYSGSAVKVMSPVRSFCSTIEALAAADDNKTFFLAPANITVTNVYCRYEGTGSTVATFTLEDGAGNGMTITGTNPTCVTGSSNASKAAVTASNTLVTGEALRFDVTNAVSPETDTYTLCVDYTIDRT